MGPVLSPDGRRVAYSSEEGLKVLGLETRGGEAEAVPSIESLRPTDWSESGNVLILDEGTASQGVKSDVLALDLDLEQGGELTPRRIVATDASEYDGRLSPDGRFLAYVSDQTGRDEVWIASFPVSAAPSESLAMEGQAHASGKTAGSSST